MTVIGSSLYWKHYWLLTDGRPPLLAVGQRRQCFALWASRQASLVTTSQLAFLRSWKERVSTMENRGLCDLILKVTSQHFSHILWWKWIIKNTPNSRRKNYKKGPKWISNLGMQLGFVSMAVHHPLLNQMPDEHDFLNWSIIDLHSVSSIAWWLFL